MRHKRSLSPHGAGILFQRLPEPISSLTDRISSSNLESRLLKAALRQNTRALTARHLPDHDMLCQLQDGQGFEMREVRFKVELAKIGVPLDQDPRPVRTV